MALRVVRRTHEEERGQVLPLLIGAMFLFVLFGVLVLDFGMMFVDRRAAQRAVDLAALAAAQELPGRSNDPDLAAKLAAAENVANDYLAANGFTGGADGISLTVTTNYQNDPAKIEVRAGREFAWLFGGLFGLVSQQIDARAVATANAQPRDVVLLLDRSASMCLDTHPVSLYCPDPPGDPDGNGLADWQPFDTMRSASIDFGGVLVPTVGGESLDRLSLIAYSTLPEVRTQLGTSYGPGSPYTSAIAAMRPGGSTWALPYLPDGFTNIGGALELARAELAARGRPEALKVIVLLSDGKATAYRNPWNPSRFTVCLSADCVPAEDYAREQARAAAQAGYSIYTIGYTERAGGALLRDIADIGAAEGGGGEFFSVEDPDLLRATFYEIASLTSIGLIE
jgi:hypothetical protein